MNAIEVSANNFTKAVHKLQEGVDQADDELSRDGVIQRFEFTFELFWKILKLILDFEGINCYSPRSCIKEAFRRNMFVDGEVYLDMLEDRNRSSHVYDEDTSREIYDRIESHYARKLSEAEEKFREYIAEKM